MLSNKGDLSTDDARAGATLQGSLIGDNIESSKTGHVADDSCNSIYISNSIKAVCTEEELRRAKVLSGLQCGKCSSIAQRCMVASQFAPGKCVSLQCHKSRECKPWFLCLVCDKPVSKKRAKAHFKCPSHVAAYGNSQRPQEMTLDKSISSNSTPTAMEIAQSGDEFDLEGKSNESETIISSLTTNAGAMSFVSTRRESTHWLESAYAHLPKASIVELISSFENQLNMRLYFAAEHGKRGGGIQYLVTRMVKRSEHIGGAVGVDIATFDEARWHFLSFVQYISMGEKQRKRQSQLTSAIASAHLHNSFFRATRPLLHQEQNKFYGRSNQHTLWNALPVPTTRNVDGIGYVNPVDACRFLLAFSTELDDFTAEFRKQPEGNTDATMVEETEAVVFHITQSKCMQDWKRSVEASVDNQMATKYKRFVLAWATDWRDGFGANRTKQNRKSTNGWTFSLSTPRACINGIDNTLPIALGLKKNPSWPKVEQIFRQDMERLTNGDKPIMVYHGGYQKVIPVCIRRVACLTDKVERGDYTATLSCTSTYHRKFGTIVCLEPPRFKLDHLKTFLDGQKKGTSDGMLRQYGWSHRYVDTSVNGGLYPACFNCRRNNVNLLRDVATFGGDIPNLPCANCANWVLDETTKQMLRFKAPKSYPVSELPNCPVRPPDGRTIGLQYLELIRLDFGTLKAAARYAFFNCCAKIRTGWTKEVCRSYLRSCGINGKQQDELYEAARQAFRDNVVVDYGEGCAKLGRYEMPAAWTGELPVHQFIEMLMHLLFLGIAKSNFKLTNKFLASVGRGEQTFKKAVQELLRKLTVFNLAWCLVLPFNGSTKAKLTTGTWVSENWLAWVRIQKVVYVWFAQKIQDERKGANDVIRVVACFTALVARVCSHSGVNKKLLGLVDCLVKEFLSSVRELDVRVRHKEMNAFANSSIARSDVGGSGRTEQTTGTSNNLPGDDKSREQFWLKSNYMSLTNLVGAMILLGPLINFWDGGGKGERYIQEIKPHIPRGVRDGGQFFLRLLEKLFKLKAMELIELALTSKQDTVDKPISVEGSSSSDSSGSGSKVSTHTSTVSQLIDATIPTTIHLMSDDGSSSNEDEDQEEEEQWSSPMEDAQMSKARTIYVYKRRGMLQEAFGNQDPISFIVKRAPTGTAEAYALYKKKGSRSHFGWCKIEFDDSKGVNLGGLWYAPMRMTNCKAQPPRKFDKIKQIARMSAVAIPLKFMLGGNHADAGKYCVLTNWWRERNEKGYYVLPNLDFERYEEGNQTATDER